MDFLAQANLQCIHLSSVEARPWVAKKQRQMYSGWDFLRQNDPKIQTFSNEAGSLV